MRILAKFDVYQHTDPRRTHHILVVQAVYASEAGGIPVLDWEGEPNFIERVDLERDWHFVSNLHDLINLSRRQTDGTVERLY